MRLVFSVFFYKFNPSAFSEMNQIWIVSSICIDGATLKILVLCVSWFTRKLVYILRNEPNLDCFQHMYRRGDAENFGSVCLMVREKIGLH